MSEDSESSLKDASEDAFEAELRAEVQADLDQRLAQADAESPEPDPGPELEVGGPVADSGRGVWDDTDDEDSNYDPDEDEGPVVMRPFPGMGGHNAIVGGGNLIAAFQEEVDPSAGYLVGELPGEQLFAIDGPRSGDGVHWGHALVLGLCLAPIIAIALGIEDLFPPKEYENLVTYTVFGTIFVGLALGLFFVVRAGYDGGRAVCTTEGIGVESHASAAWIPWDEIWAYEHERKSSLWKRSRAQSASARPRRRPGA